MLQVAAMAVGRMFAAGEGGGSLQDPDVQYAQLKGDLTVRWPNFSKLEPKTDGSLPECP